MPDRGRTLAEHFSQPDAIRRFFNFSQIAESSKFTAFQETPGGSSYLATALAN